MTQPEYVLRFAPPLTISNLLPFDITVVVTDGPSVTGAADPATYHIGVGGRAEVYQFDLTRKLRMSVQMQVRPRHAANPPDRAACNPGVCQEWRGSSGSQRLEGCFIINIIIIIIIENSGHWCFATRPPFPPSPASLSRLLLELASRRNCR